MELKKLRGEYTGASHYANMLKKEIEKGNITEREYNQIIKAQYNKAGHDWKGRSAHRCVYSSRTFHAI